MKLQIVSDLHLEFAPIQIDNAGADALVLSGDICVANYFKRGPESPYYAKAIEFHEFFAHVSKQFPIVFYILGNHEHYRGYLPENAFLLQRELTAYPNIIVLDMGFTDYGGYRFIGGTLWTDFDKGDPLAMNQAEFGLNDFRLITTEGYRKLSPHYVFRKHKDFLNYISDNVTKNTIVLGHHGPSWESVSGDYRSGRYSHLNPAYVSDLTAFIEQRPDIKLWTHGHVHSSHDYMIGETRIFANPRGYANKNGPPENSDFNPNIIVEI